MALLEDNLNWIRRPAPYQHPADASPCHPYAWPCRI